MTKRQHLARGAVLAAVAAALLAVPAAPALGCAGVLDVVYVTTFDVTIEPRQQEYRVGDTVTVDVTVMRPAREDPLGLGNPTPAPQQVPAGGIRGAVSLRFSKGFVFGWGITGEDGTMQVDIHLDDRITPGPAKASAYAWVSYPLACMRVDEVGYLEVGDFVTVHPAESQ